MRGRLGPFPIIPFAKAEAERAGAVLERQQSSYKRRVGAGGKPTPTDRAIEAHYLDRHHQASLLLARGERWLEQHGVKRRASTFVVMDRRKLIEEVSKQLPAQEE